MARTLVMHDFNADFATMNHNLQFKGYSGRISCKITTDYICEDEQVIVDFGTAKKLIKFFIDYHHERDSLSKEMRLEWVGIDHKLIVPYNIGLSYNNDGISFENENIYYKPISGALNQADGWRANDFKFEYLNLEKMFNKFIKVLIYNDFGDKFNVTQDQLLALYNAEVEFDFKEDEMPYFDPNEWDMLTTFNYVHGLPNSTSYGCQNTFHGHRSAITVRLKTINADPIILNDILNLIFTDQTYVFTNKITNQVRRSWETRDRGECVLYLKNAPLGYSIRPYSPIPQLINGQNYVQLDKDSTIENLVVYFKNTIISTYNLYQNKKIDKDDIIVYVSEGMQKGAQL